MTNTNFRRTLVGAAVAAALGVLATPAAAAPYRGVFDPTDFAGEYIINVNRGVPRCTSGWHANAGICAATLLSAYADVVSVGSGRSQLHRPADLRAPRHFELARSCSESTSMAARSIRSTRRRFRNKASRRATPDNWLIQFTSGQAPVAMLRPPVIGPDGALAVRPDLQGRLSLPPTSWVIIASAQYIGRAVDIGGIPEPGTLSLLLGALGGGWLARRRRKEKVPDPN